MNEELFNKLTESVKEMKLIEAGEKKPSRVHKRRGPAPRKLTTLAQIRAKSGMSQANFADLLGTTPGTYRNWEQERTSVPKIAIVAAQIAVTEPKVYRKALESV